MGTGNEIEVFSQTLKHKGFFNYSEFYNYCYDWLKDEGFEVAEEEYTEKISDFGKEILIKWVYQRKISDYVKHKGVVAWHILGLTDAEVMVDGKKKKTNKGELKLKIKAVLDKDYDSKWDASPLLKMLRGTYDRYIIRASMKLYEDRLRDKITSFVKDVKSYLNLEGK